MLKMTNAASQQALEEGKKRLREFLESSDTGRQAIAMSGQEGIIREKLDMNGRKAAVEEDDEEL